LLVSVSGVPGFSVFNLLKFFVNNSRYYFMVLLLVLSVWVDFQWNPKRHLELISESYKGDQKKRERDVSGI
jgi:hypothetical protein